MYADERLEARTTRDRIRLVTADGYRMDYPQITQITQISFQRRGQLQTFENRGDRNSASNCLVAITLTAKSAKSV